MSSIDEDTFIYGDTNSPNDAPDKDGQNKENTADDGVASMTHNGDDKDEPAVDSATEEPPVTAESANGQHASVDGDSDSDQDDEGDSSDEDDLVVILEPGGAAAGAQVTDSADLTKSLGGGDNANGQITTNDTNEKVNTQELLSTNASHMDILSVPLLNNLDLYTIDIDMLEEKPWRQPGADITDYFNFGFSEEAWKLYCVKQQDVRAKFSAHKMMPPHMMMMPGMNPAMFPGMMNPGFRPDMAGGMFPPGMAPPFNQQKQPGEQSADKEDGDRSSNGGKESDGNALDRSNGDSVAVQGKDGGPPRVSGAPGMPAPQNPMQMTPQQLQFQQQQMRMSMPPGFFPGTNFPPGMGGMQRGMPMNQQQMMQMQMQMQMGNRPPMPQNPQAAAHQRQGPNTGAGQGSVAMGHQPPPPPPLLSKQNESAEHRNSDRGSDTGRMSRRHASRERSGSRRPPRDWEEERHRSQSRHGRGRERNRVNEREHARGRDSARGENEKAAPADSKRSSDRRRDRSRDRGGRSRGNRGGNERSDKPASKRRRSASKEEEPKSTSRRRR
ncbi:cleavage polyadenylation factor subunit fip1 [Coemansia sp. RSA 1365]|nr:cleavage polyadenylation factor subunit fip1 [Coemansia sp. RSA 1365]